MKSLKLYSIFILFFLIINQISIAQNQVFENYGVLSNESVVSEKKIETVSVGDIHAVYSNWIDQDNEVFLLNNEGELLNVIELDTDSSSFSPNLFVQEETFFLMGYESKLPISIDTSDLKLRKWKIQQYNTEGVLLFENSTQVNSQDIGLLSTSLINGVTADAIYFNHNSGVGTVSRRYCTQFFETILFDPTTQNLSTGPIVKYQYDRVSNTFTGTAENLLFNSLADMVSLDTIVRLYAIRGSNINDITMIHTVAADLDTITSLFEPSLYGQAGLSFYAEADANFVYEVKATAIGLLAPNMESIELTKKTWDNEVVQSRTLATDRAPFGKFSIVLGKDNDLFILSADVINRSPIQLRIDRVSKTDLTTLWSFDLDPTIFGLSQSIVPVSDGIIVYGGRSVLENNTLLSTKITSDGLISSINQLENKPSIIKGPNPATDFISIEEIPVDATAQWYDFQGRLVGEERIVSNQLSTPVLKGQYILIIFNDRNEMIAREKIIRH